MSEFHEWLGCAYARGKQVARQDRTLAAFLKSRQDQIKRVIRDRHLLIALVGRDELQEELSDELVDRLRAARNLSPRAARYLGGGGLRGLIQSRRRQGRRLTAGYVVNRVTTLDWGILDLFYELMGFAHFRRAFDLAEKGPDEGPICNLALITQYLSRFQAQNSAVLSASFLDQGLFVRKFFNSFLYALWRRGESEYENAEDPFPKGRIPFLTVHQAKGLDSRWSFSATPGRRSLFNPWRRSFARSSPSSADRANPSIVSRPSTWPDSFTLHCPARRICSLSANTGGRAIG